MKNILFLCNADERWMGGVYYVRNMIFALLQNDAARENLNIYILTKSGVAGAFRDLENDGKVHIVISDQLSTLQKIRKKIKKLWYVNIRKIEVNRDLLLNVVERYKIDYIYPVQYREDKYADKGIMWIADFQHIHYPEFFQEDELQEREMLFEYIARNHRKLVLSSNSAKQDYLSKYPQYEKGVYVIPFVSAIDSRIIQEDGVKAAQEKYGIFGQYFLISNQFWKHKNHKTVLEALNYAKRQQGVHMSVVCTGFFSDYRDVAYTEGLKKYIEDNQLEDNFRILGLIDREDQLQLMKGCIAVIQPSLFEGWGTVVEDAKTLKKKIIMSDIDVHLEQKNTDCILYKRHDSQQLAKIMMQCWENGAEKEEQSRYDYVKQASEYGKLFYDMLMSE